MRLKLYIACDFDISIKRRQPITQVNWRKMFHLAHIRIKLMSTLLVKTNAK